MNQRSDVSSIEWLESWYRAHCNGDWEHQNGIRITTLDNPGWSLDVDLGETELADRAMPEKLLNRTDIDWVFVEVREGVFHARGGSGNLIELIGLFRAFVDGLGIDIDLASPTP
jgi:hypothetical protein